MSVSFMLVRRKGNGACLRSIPARHTPPPSKESIRAATQHHELMWAAGASRVWRGEVNMGVLRKERIAEWKGLYRLLDGGWWCSAEKIGTVVLFGSAWE